MYRPSVIANEKLCTVYTEQSAVNIDYLNMK